MRTKEVEIIKYIFLLIYFILATVSCKKIRPENKFKFKVLNFTMRLDNKDDGVKYSKTRSEMFTH